jgi:tetratricopeptide (TPR) repeat protein
MLWGVNHLAFLPVSPWVAVLWPLVGVALIWWTSTSIPLHRFGLRTGSVMLGRPAVAYGLLPCLGAGVFWLLRTRTQYLGDGALLAIRLAQGQIAHGFDFTAYRLHAWLMTLLNLSTESGAVTVLAVTSVVTGGIYLAAAAWTVRRLDTDPARRLALYGLLIFAAPTQLFLGYAECYAQLAVALLLFAATLLLHLRGELALAWPAGWFAVGLFFHLDALFLAPVLLAAAVRGRQERARRLIIAISPSGLALALAMGVALVGGEGPGDLVRGILASVEARPLLIGPAYDWRLGKDVVNLVLLLVPAPLALLLTCRGGDSAAKLLKAAAGWLLLLACTLRLHLGVVRDWDLLAAPTVIVALAAIAAEAAPANRRWPGPLGAAAVTAFFLAVPWFVMNALPSASSARTVRITEDLPAYPRAVALEVLGRWHRDHGDLPRAVEFYRAAAAACPARVQFPLVYGQALYQAGKVELSLAPLRQATALAPANPAPLRSLVLSLIALDRLDEALRQARRLDDLPHADAAASQMHGELAARAGAIDEAVAAYLRAMRKDQNRFALMARIGDLELARSQYARAVHAYRLLLEKDPSSVAGRSGLATAEQRAAAAASASR